MTERSASVAIILIFFLLLMGIFARSLWAYQTDLKLQSCAEVVVKLLQAEVDKSEAIPHWGLCSTGDPARPSRLYLCKYGPKAVPLFTLETRYPIRTYLDQTPFEYNLRFLVTHDLEAKARLEEDRKRLKESREKFKALLKELGIDSSQINKDPVYREMLAGLNKSVSSDFNLKEEHRSDEDQLSKLRTSPVTAVLGQNVNGNEGSIQGIDVVRSGAGGATTSRSLFLSRFRPDRDSKNNKIQGPVTYKTDSDWIDKVFDGIMAAIHWFTHNLDVIGIILGLFLLLGLFTRK